MNVLNSRRTAHTAPVRISIWFPGINPDNFGNTGPSKALREDFPASNPVWGVISDRLMKVKALLKDFTCYLIEHSEDWSTGKVI